MYAGLLLPMTLKINPVPIRKTPRGIINKPLLSFFATLMILSFKSVNFSISDNADTIQNSQDPEEKRYSATIIAMHLT